MVIPENCAVFGTQKESVWWEDENEKKGKKRQKFNLSPSHTNEEIHDKNNEMESHTVLWALPDSWWRLEKAFRITQLFIHLFPIH